MENILLLLSMIFLAIFDDYVLQIPFLAKYKQKESWKEYGDKYRNDYKMCLCLHSFSWTFLMMLPAMVMVVAKNDTVKSAFCMVVIFLANVIVHCIIDDLKANKKKINLIVDQIIHMVCIIITFVLVIFIISN